VIPNIIGSLVFTLRNELSLKERFSSGYKQSLFADALASIVSLSSEVAKIVPRGCRSW
jgi:hypothetical protein